MGKPPSYIRHNAKARVSVAGGSLKRGKLKKQATSCAAAHISEATFADSNAEMILPRGEDEERLRLRKEELEAELVATSESKMSRKKKKKLESYITKKLKKEERVILLEKLAQTQAQVPSTMLHSSSVLGSGQLRNNAQRLEHEEHIAVRRALDRSSHSRKRRKISRNTEIPVDEGGGGGGSDPDENIAVGLPKRVEDFNSMQRPLERELHHLSPPLEDVHAAGGVPEKPLVVNKPVGSGLKRAPGGTLVAPRIVARRPKPSREALRRRGKVVQSVLEPEQDEDDEQDEDVHSTDSSESLESSDTDSSDTDSSSAESVEELVETRTRGTGFKEWAQRQIDLAKAPIAGPSNGPDHPAENLLERPIVCRPRPLRSFDGLLHGPLGSEDHGVPRTSFAGAVLARDGPAGTQANQPSKGFVHVNRPEDIQRSRLLLPVVAEEQSIVEAIRLNPVVVICGETGSGKTTQVPQFLYEAGFGSPGSDNPGMVGITQPRRVAAMSMASRVATELSLPPSKVSYQIRYDATVSPSTVIKFMTDGVLLRELANDLLLTRYSVIIVDEAHERSMNTDILIGVLSRVMKLRADMWEKNRNGPVKPLRLVIMSATLRVTDFSENRTLFPVSPPVITINSRQHPVTIHFNRRSPTDYVNEVVRKATKIHARLPAGGILIFLTGQDEIMTVCRKLDAAFGVRASGQKKQRKLTAANVHSRCPGDSNLATVFQGEMPPASFSSEGDKIVDEEALDSDEDDDGDNPALDTDISDVPMHIVPLYSLLSSQDQLKAFIPPPEGTRLVVVATNVAETSLTIPGVHYVIDCGRAKQREYDSQNGIQTFKITWISKASASQRAGRAGRTGPGHCYRLYSSAVFENHFQAFSEPEILQVPIEGVVLQMKSMHIDAVVNFPFPTPPDRLALRKAETLLTHLNALGFSSSGSNSNMSSQHMTIGGHITELGKAMALFPVSPRFSKMLVAARSGGILPYVIAVVATLSVGNPFLHESFLDSKDMETDEHHRHGDDPAVGMEGDLPVELDHIKNPEVRVKELRKLECHRFFKTLQLHSRLGNGVSDVFRMLSVVGAYEFSGTGSGFCSEHFVRPKAMEEIHKLRGQISNIVQSNFPEVKTPFSPSLPPPDSKQLKILRQLLTAGFIDHVAVRKDLLSKNPEGSKYSSSRGIPYCALDVEEDVFIHPSSVLFHSPPPDYVVYQEIVRSSRVWIKTVTVINPVWLHTLAPSMCTFSKPRTIPSSMKAAGGTSTIVNPIFGGRFTLPPVQL